MRALGPPKIVPQYDYNARSRPLGSYRGTITMRASRPSRIVPWYDYNEIFSPDHTLTSAKKFYYEIPPTDHPPRIGSEA
eukprot:5051045-Ditylum_brightwellii.AAC.1